MGEGFWKETGRKVVKRQRTRAQSWFVKHPMTFGLAWGVKGLVWNLPKWGITSGYRAWTGKPAKVKAVDNDTVQSVTVTEIIDSDGNISTSTRTTTTTGAHTEFPFPGTATAGYNGFAMAPPQPVGASTSNNNGRPTLVVDPIKRMEVINLSETLLQKSPLGKAFLGLSSEISAFVPVRGHEAESTVELIGAAYLGFKRISMGVDTFADIVADLGLHRAIVNQLYNASAAADGLDRAMKRANGHVMTLHAGQLEQEASGAVAIASAPVPVGVGVDAEGVGPLSAVIASHYEAFAPPLDGEATAVFDYIRISQAGFAVLSDGLTILANSMNKRGLDRRVKLLVATAGGDALEAADYFRAARVTMSRLYRGQMNQEASGVTTIRTMPMSRAS